MKRQVEWKGTSELSTTPDLLLPGQLPQGSGAERSGCRELLRTLLVDGVETWIDDFERGRLTRPRFLEADFWIFGPREDRLTSFDTLCDLFDVDAERLRQHLGRKRAQVDLPQPLPV